MAYIEPNTTVEFLTVPFDPDYENTMYWRTEAEQNTWMTPRVIVTVDRNSYQRKSRGVIRVGWTADLETPVRKSVIESLYNSNYMRFKNTNYENKWFYAFVKRVEYVNNNTVDVYYDIDVMQTWACRYELLECFIERQHTITDDIGEHTVPEGLETGPYLEEPLSTSGGDQPSNSKFSYNAALCLITTFDSNGDYCDGTIIHGRSPEGTMFSGLYYTIWVINDQNLTAINDTLKAISGGLEVISESGVKIPRFYADGVVALFTMPFQFASSITSSPAASVVNYFDIRKSNSYVLGNYEPRNKKLLCYPYNLIYITNNQGNSAEFKWEDFSTPLQCQFNVWGNVSPNGGMYIAPVGYKNYPYENPDEMLQVTGFPPCSWSYDAYKAWVAQNAGTLAAGAIGIVGKWAEIVGTGGAGALFGSSPTPQSFTQVGAHEAYNPSVAYNPVAGTGGVSGAIAATLGAVGQIYDHSRRPPQARGNGNTSLAYQSGYLTFYYYRKFIKEEYAEIIDAFFDMYGYKVNMVGVPNRNARPCYTYIKTIGCAIDGLLPADDAQKIQSIFNNGIRFWNSSAIFGVYSPSVNDNRVTIEG